MTATRPSRAARAASTSAAPSTGRASAGSSTMGDRVPSKSSTTAASAGRGERCERHGLASRSRSRLPAGRPRAAGLSAVGQVGAQQHQEVGARPGRPAAGRASAAPTSGGSPSCGGQRRGLGLEPRDRAAPGWSSTWSSAALSAVEDLVAAAPGSSRSARRPRPARRRRWPRGPRPRRRPGGAAVRCRVAAGGLAAVRVVARWSRGLGRSTPAAPPVSSMARQDEEPEHDGDGDQHHAPDGAGAPGGRPVGRSLGGLHAAGPPQRPWPSGGAALDPGPAAHAAGRGAAGGPRAGRRPRRRGRRASTVQQLVVAGGRQVEAVADGGPLRRWGGATTPARSRGSPGHDR